MGYVLHRLPAESTWVICKKRSLISLFKLSGSGDLADFAFADLEDGLIADGDHGCDICDFLVVDAHCALFDKSPGFRITRSKAGFTNQSQQTDGID